MILYSVLYKPNPVVSRSTLLYWQGGSGVCWIYSGGGGMVSMSLSGILLVVESTPLLYVTPSLVSDGDAAAEARFFSSTLLLLNSLVQYCSALLCLFSIFRSACFTVKDPGDKLNASFIFKITGKKYQRYLHTR